MAETAIWCRALGSANHVGVRLYLVVDRSLPESIDVHLCREDAEQMVADVLRDEPGWRPLLSVRPLDLPDELWHLREEDWLPLR